VVGIKLHFMLKGIVVVTGEVTRFQVPMLSTEKFKGKALNADFIKPRVSNKREESVQRCIGLYKMIELGFHPDV